MVGSKTRYKIKYGSFIGVDESSDPSVVTRNRIAHAVNMWRDYGSENGAAIETIPGFRRLFYGLSDNNGDDSTSVINGLYLFKSRNGTNHFIIHVGTALIRVAESDLLGGTNINTFPFMAVTDGNLGYIRVANNKSQGFVFNNKLYILDGTNYIEISDEATTVSGTTYYSPGCRIINSGYVPTTYYNGEMYEQRNMLALTAVQIDNGYPAETTTETYQTVVNGETVDNSVTVRRHYIYEKAVAVTSVKYNGSSLVNVVAGITVTYQHLASPNVEHNFYIAHTKDGYIDYVDEVITIDNSGGKIEITLTLTDGTFTTADNVSNVKQGNTAYTGTFANAIKQCRKCAIYDGRIFFTGNPNLPNTVFYSQRNITGANDPTYFGVFNYINDGDGNNPNVDMLSTPNYLMVLKGNSANEGTIFYHTAQYNEDDNTKNLIPRIYPSTQGSAGIGSVANGNSYNLACNFLDDAVFLSRRGLDAIGKATLNLERTITHRSSNVDRLLHGLDLSKSSIAEWLGYLVVSCGSKMFLADSRVIKQHEDGSYQYEWFILDNIGTYASYSDAYRTVAEFPYFNGVSLGDYENIAQEKLSDTVNVYGSEVLIGNLSQTTVDVSHGEDTKSVKYVNIDGTNYLVDIAYGEKVGSGTFKSPSAILVVDERLYFVTDNGDICVFNTDKRGAEVNGFSYGSDKFHSSYYSFAGVRYNSELALRNDDCDSLSLRKTTVPHSCVARFKSLPNGKTVAYISRNGLPFNSIKTVYTADYSEFSDVNFENLTIGDAGEIYVNIPDREKSWNTKQFLFVSDCPFGLYGLEFQYVASGYAK